VTSALIGASRPAQIEEIVNGVAKPALSPEVLAQIETILST
jgi:aryl-alcohol dehydrogenase-like predicted oxidoreductase